MTFKGIFTSFYSWKRFNTGLLCSLLATILVILIWTLTGYIDVGPFPSLGVEGVFYIILGTIIFVLLETSWQVLKLIFVLVTSLVILLGLKSKIETTVEKIH